MRIKSGNVICRKISIRLIVNLAGAAPRNPKEGGRGERKNKMELRSSFRRFSSSLFLMSDNGGERDRESHPRKGPFARRPRRRRRRLREEWSPSFHESDGRPPRFFVNIRGGAPERVDVDDLERETRKRSFLIYVKLCKVLIAQCRLPLASRTGVNPLPDGRHYPQPFSGFPIFSPSCSSALRIPSQSISRPSFLICEIVVSVDSAPPSPSPACPSNVPPPPPPVSQSQWDPRTSHPSFSRLTAWAVK